MAIWHLGVGRHKEKLRADAPGKGELGTRCPGLSPFPKGCMRSQCRAGPSLQAQGRWTLSLLGGGARMDGGRCGGSPSQQEGQNATETAR